MKESLLIFEISRKGRHGVLPAPSDVPRVKPSEAIPEAFLRKDIAGFPEVSEMDCVRHYTTLSQKNVGIDSVFYPLGSCTMKYNPKINEVAARLTGFTALHPYEDEGMAQGALELMSELERALSEISGMHAVTLQPAAGAHGELCGMLVVAAYFKDKNKPRKKIIIPDTAHGTNPASAHLAGFHVTKLESGKDGILTPDKVRAVMDEDTAALMLTNPNTLGLFEENIREIAGIVHSKGGFIYCDGANLNALMGIARLSDMGVDLVQFNLHKTFSTPHGGGGPGSGPLGVAKALEPYLPSPKIVKDKNIYRLDSDRPKSIGRLKAFYGNFAILVRAYAYILSMGKNGLRQASEMAILNANYIKAKLKDSYYLPFEGTCMHECVFTDKLQSLSGVTTLDIAKRLMDFGFHPPTIYFPLVAPGAIMIEPTETENPETLDCFIEAMKEIAREAAEDPAILKEAPFTTKISRVDEVKAAREPVVRWTEKHG